MHLLVDATVVGLAAGVVGTGIGALAIAVAGTPTRRSLSIMMGLAGGVMRSVVFLDLVPEAVEIGGTGTLGGFVSRGRSDRNVDLHRTSISSQTRESAISTCRHTHGDRHCHAQPARRAWL